MRKGTVYLESLGCSGNRTDSAYVIGLLRTHGFEITSDPREADGIIVMTCGYSTTHEGFSLRRLRHLHVVKRARARLIVGGCLPDIAGPALTASGVELDAVFGPRSLEKALELLGGGMDAANSSVGAQVEGGDYLVRVSTGCMSKCSYCAIRLATGTTKSRSIAQVLDQMRQAHELGFQRVRLISEDIGAWGVDIGLDVGVLLTEVLAEADRLDMGIITEGMSPIWFRKHVLRREDLLSSRRWLAPLSLPFQSGSDRILELMRRGHSREDIDTILTRLDKLCPWRTVTTDFIVGFPSETEQDFADTKSLLEKYSFGFCELFAYQARPGTDSLGIRPEVPEEEKRVRLTRLFLALLDRQLRIQGKTFDQLQMEIAAGTYVLPVNMNISYRDLDLSHGMAPRCLDEFEMWVPAMCGSQLVPSRESGGVR